MSEKRGVFGQLKFEMWPIDRCVYYARNPRKNDYAVDKVAAAIKEFGFRVPIVVKSDGLVVDGHLRLKAAKKLGLKEVPVVLADDMTEAQIKAFRLSVNKVAELAEWDEELLKIELQELDGLDFDLDLIGFDASELDDLLSSTETTEGLTDEDAVPETPQNPVSAPGDVWILGRHRLMCGDSASPEAVERLMDGNRPVLLFTSPPYSQQRDYGAAKEKIGDWDALMIGVFSAALAAIDDCAQVLVNLGLVHDKGEWSPYWDSWIEWMRKSGWRRFGFYVWDQGPGLPGDWSGRLAPAHEFIFHFNKESRRANKTKSCKCAGAPLTGGGLRAKDGTIKEKTGSGGKIQDRKIPDSVIRVMRHAGGLGAVGSHPAIFPVGLASEIITAFSDAGESVYEPFASSGTTIIAGERDGRHIYAMEIDPVYVDIAISRWQAFTGQEATLEATGQTFAEVSGDRHV